MKKKILILLSAIITLITSACEVGDKEVFNKLYGGESKAARETLDKLVEAMESEDVNAVKDVFANNTLETVENWDQSIQNLFQYYKGEFVSCSDEGTASSEEFDYGNVKKEIFASFDVETTEDVYRIYFYEVIVDTTASDNVGIKSLYIIRKEDDTDPNISYRGDDNNVPGINLEVKNSLPVEY